MTSPLPPPRMRPPVRPVHVDGAAGPPCGPGDGVTGNTSPAAREDPQTGCSGEGLVARGGGAWEGPPDAPRSGVGGRGRRGIARAVGASHRRRAMPLSTAGVQCRVLCDRVSLVDVACGREGGGGGAEMHWKGRGLRGGPRGG